MKDRNEGIDLLRIIAMLMVVVLHCFTAGGIMDNAIKGSIAYNTSAIMMIINYAGVDIFAIISGYVAYYNEGKRIDLSKFIELWIQVVFYGVLLNIIFGLVNPNLNVVDNYISVLFPVTAVTYWYFSAYTGLFVMKPIIDKGLQNASERLLKCMVLIVLLFVAFISTYSNAFMLNYGYTVLWILMLYIIGYSINRYDMMKKYNNIVLISIIVLSMIITFVSILLIPEKKIFFVDIYPTMFLVYVSPTTVIISICLVVLFSRIRISSKFGKGISLLSATAFSIYIVDCHPMIWQLIVKNAFVQYADSNAITILVKVFSFSIPFVLFVVLFDLFRIYLFKLCKISVLADKIESFICSIFIKMSSIF